MTSATPQPLPPPGEAPGLHVAIIMDGNGRWATARGCPRTAGHRAGGRTVRRVVEAAPDLGIGTLTLYALSSDNWHRPAAEVATLLGLLQEYLATETASCRAQGVRLDVIGRRGRLPRPVLQAIARAEAATGGGRRLHLRIALDYSSRDAILRAAQRLPAAWHGSGRTFARLLAEVDHGAAPAPDVDLLIRTGGEQRLSDFLLWECAYAELVFTGTMWPDFSARELAAAVGEFQARERRFGRVSGSAGG